MLKVTITMVPHGDESKAYTLAEGAIVNDGKGSDTVGNYIVELRKSQTLAKSPGVWRRGLVRGFPRRRFGPWDLLFRALEVCVGERNRKS